MTTSSRSVALAVALSIALPFAPAAVAAPSAADMESARQLFKEGKDLRDKGDLKGAREKLKAAHALGQTPITGVELGKTHVMLNELVEAREAFLSVGRIAVASDETKKSADARIECDKLAAELKTKIPKLRVVLTGVPAGQSAKVTVDGEEVPSAALSEARSVNPGHHVVVAKVGENPESRAEVDLKESESKDVTLAVSVSMTTSKPEPRPEGTPPGPLPGPAPPPSGNNTFTSKPPAHDDTPSSTSPLVYIGFGAAAVGVVVGGITGGLALSKANDVKSQCPNSTCPADKRGLLEDTKTFATVSNISFALAGAGVVLGLVGLMKKPSTDTAHVQPYVGVGSLGLTGAF